MATIPIAAIRTAQSHLQSLGLYSGRIDGKLDENTENALDLALARRQSDLASAHADGVLGRSRRRKLTAYIQLMAQDEGIEAGVVDGFWGPQTDYAFSELVFLLQHGQRPHAWRDYEGPGQNPNHWPDDNQESLQEFYGEPGNPPLVQVDLPYSLHLSWDLSTRVRRLSCHQKVADSLHRVLTAVLSEYGGARIHELRLNHFGGSYAKRNKRGGNTWSTHAWGVALDFDPGKNQLQWGRDRAHFARPEYDAWWACWEAEGWVSLGRVANYDWMHIQAARRVR